MIILYKNHNHQKAVSNTTIHKHTFIKIGTGNKYYRTNKDKDSVKFKQFDTLCIVMKIDQMNKKIIKYSLHPKC